MKTHERFWSKVDRLGPNECWEWKAGRDRDGYGVFCENRNRLEGHVEILMEGLKGADDE